MSHATLTVPALIAATIGAGLSSGSLIAQKAAAPPPSKAAARVEAAVPFRVGERLTYNVSWSPFITIGTVDISVREKKPSYNSTAFYIGAEGHAVGTIARLRTFYYKMDTLLDVYTLLSQRGSLYSDEGGRKRFRVTRFDREAQKALVEYQAGTPSTSELGVQAGAQDALSGLYALRAARLAAGDHLIVPIIDSGRSYAVRLDVAGRERVSTPLGSVGAWKLQATIHDAQNQPVGKNLAIWISEDARRLPLRVQGGLTVGRFEMTLVSLK
jgi:hypothetical protein